MWIIEEFRRIAFMRLSKFFLFIFFLLSDSFPDDNLRPRKPEWIVLKVLPFFFGTIYLLTITVHGIQLIQNKTVTQINMYIYTDTRTYVYITGW